MPPATVTQAAGALVCCSSCPDAERGRMVAVEPLGPGADQAKLTQGGNDPVMLGVAEHHRIHRPTGHDPLLEGAIATPQARIGPQSIAKAPHGRDLGAGGRDHMYMDPVI